MRFCGYFANVSVVILQMFHATTLTLPHPPLHLPYHSGTWQVTKMHLGLLKKLPNKHPLGKSAPLTPSWAYFNSKLFGSYTSLPLLTKHCLFLACKLELLADISLYCVSMPLPAQLLIK